jgi:hypothetical protein
MDTQDWTRYGEFGSGNELPELHLLVFGNEDEHFGRWV